MPKRHKRTVEKRFRVLISPEAETDLDSLFAFIADHSGKHTALGFTSRLRDYCLGLGTAPERGMRRDDLGVGLRLLGYRRRATIAFVLSGDEVVILRILYRGRDVDALLDGRSDSN